MIDKTNPSKEVEKYISDSITSGVPKNEIYSQVKSKYPAYDDDSVAKKIASYIKEDVKKRNVIYTYILAIFVIISLVFSFITPSFYSSQAMQIYDWSWRIIVGIIAIFFIIGFLQFKLFYYTTAVSLYSLYLVLLLYNFFVYPISLLLIISSVGTVVTFVYLYLLRKRIFPNISLWGTVIKENGIYKF
ncbi:MAG: hypothetical protein AB1521_16550 [Bacteroidota bacterium]